MMRSEKRRSLTVIFNCCGIQRNAEEPTQNTINLDSKSGFS